MADCALSCAGMTFWPLLCPDAVLVDSRTGVGHCNGACEELNWAAPSPNGNHGGATFTLTPRLRSAVAVLCACRNIMDFSEECDDAEVAREMPLWLEADALEWLLGSGLWTLSCAGYLHPSSAVLSAEEEDEADA